MKQFWQYTQDNPRQPSPVNDRTAYVLPQYYAYGFRGPTDRIWGLWDSDELTSNLCLNMSALMLQYGTNLDIIYPDAPQAIESIGYRDIFYYNDTRLAPTPSPSPDPSQATASTLPFYETPNYFYAVAASILLVAAVAATALALKFRKKPLRQNDKF
jgi:hypothetical protein